MDIDPRGLLLRLLAALLARSQNALFWAEGWVGMYSTVFLPVESETTVAFDGSHSKVPSLGPFLFLVDLVTEPLVTLFDRANGAGVLLLCVGVVGALAVVAEARDILQTSCILAFASSGSSSSVS